MCVSRHTCKRVRGFVRHAAESPDPARAQNTPPSEMMLRRYTTLFGFGLLAILSCSDAGSTFTGPGPGPTVASVAVTPPQAMVQVGGATTLTAVAADAGGKRIAGSTIAWSSSNASVATVSDAGVVMALTTGTATITASSGGRLGSSSVTVIPVPVATVSISPSTSTAIVGDSVTLVATARDASGAALIGRIVSWTSSSSAAPVRAGVVSGTGAGTVTITATVEGQAGVATVTFTPRPVTTVLVTPASTTIYAGRAAQLSAITSDTTGTTVTGRVVTWSVNDARVATVSSVGLVTAIAAGSASVTATSEGRSGTAAITVLADLSSFAIVQPSATVEVAQTTTLSTVTQDVTGATVAGAPVSWSTSNAGVATVSSTGVVTGVAAGSVTITAISGGRTATVPVTVTPIPVVASVSVTPATSTLSPALSATFTATARDAAGIVIVGRAVTWTTSNAAVATVSSGGVVTAISLGTTTVSATINGQVGSATITVTMPPRASLQFDGATYATIPHSASLAITTPFTVETWVKSDAANAGDFNDFVSKEGSGTAFSGLGFRVSNGTALTAGISMSQLPLRTRGVANPSLTPNTLMGVWQHVALVWDGTTLRSYLNGQIVSEVDYPASTVPNFGTNPITLGSQFGAFRQFKGSVYDVRISAYARYRSAFTPALQLTADANTRALWSFGGETGTTVTDRSGNGNSGTITGTVARSADVPVGVPVIGPAGMLTKWTGDSLRALTGLYVPDVPTVQVKDANGQPVSGETVRFVPTGGGTVTAPTATSDLMGLARAGTWTLGDTAGVQSLIATGTSGANTTFTATAVRPPVSSVKVTTTAVFIVRRTGQLDVVLRDSVNRILVGRTVTWSSSNGAVATVSATGLVTGVTAGTVSMTATSEGVSGTLSITVLAGPVASVTVTPSTSTVEVGRTTPLVAAMRDSLGALLTGRAVAWTSSATAVAIVAADGTVTGTSPGSATITATSEGQVGTATVMVTASAASRVVATPHVLVIDSGATVRPVFNVLGPTGAPATDSGLAYVGRGSAGIVSTQGVVTGRERGQVMAVARSTRNMFAADSVLTVVAGAGQPVLMTNLDRFEVTSSDTAIIAVTILFDTRSSGVALGSATLQVSWDPYLLNYQGDAAAGSASVSANDGLAYSGLYRMATTSAAGLSGRVLLRTLYFKASGTAGRTGSVDVTAIEANAAGTGASILSTIVSVSHPIVSR
jgi:uncharacterized protein YjdB